MRRKRNKRELKIEGKRMACAQDGDPLLFHVFGRKTVGQEDVYVCMQAVSSDHALQLLGSAVSE